jgi:hypothetical protein
MLVAAGIIPRVALPRQLVTVKPESVYERIENLEVRLQVAEVRVSGLIFLGADRRRRPNWHHCALKRLAAAALGGALMQRPAHDTGYRSDGSAISWGTEMAFHGQWSLDLCISLHLYILLCTNI